MGKKKNKGKAVIMTQAEFDQSVADQPEKKQPESKSALNFDQLLIKDGDNEKPKKKVGKNLEEDLLGRKIGGNGDFPNYK